MDGTFTSLGGLVYTPLLTPPSQFTKHRRLPVVSGKKNNNKKYYQDAFENRSRGGTGSFALSSVRRLVLIGTVLYFPAGGYDRFHTLT